ncbi:MAG TPA: 50S ribosomal protein L11 methyltransferase [Gemmatimonadaceae bacterium]|nr:50S ribosomal protein L11 methyltransferase [Gemmatimonadaceae bacterium]
MSRDPGGARGWTALRIRPSSADAAPLVSAALFASGSLGIQEDGDVLVTQLEGAEQVAAARAAVLRADPEAQLETAPVPDVDWSEEWRKGIHAHRLGALVVTPPWLAGDYGEAERIVIEPGMAFGTGEHATTRGVVRLMQRAIRPGDRVADLGAGSAVLSIAAARLGAGSVAAIELDPEAIGNAEANVARNGVADRVRVVEGDAGVLLPLLAPVRLVLANIISSVLVALLPAIADALTADGQAILSGILLEERVRMLDVLASTGWRVEAEDAEDVWWSALISRR